MNYQLIERIDRAVNGASYCGAERALVYGFNFLKLFDEWIKGSNFKGTEVDKSKHFKLLAAKNSSKCQFTKQIISN